MLSKLGSIEHLISSVWPSLNLFCLVLDVSTICVLVHYALCKNIDNSLTKWLTKKTSYVSTPLYFYKLTDCPGRRALTQSIFPTFLNHLICSLAMFLFVLFIPPSVSLSVFPCMSLCPYLLLSVTVLYGALFSIPLSHVCRLALYHTRTKTHTQNASSSGNDLSFLT